MPTATNYLHIPFYQIICSQFYTKHMNRVENLYMYIIMSEIDASI
jgi:hypothetical protein